MQLDLYLSGLSVPGDIGDSRLGHAKAGRLQIGREAHLVRMCDKGDAKAGTLCLSPHIPFQGGDQTKVVEERWAEVEREIAGLAERALDDANTLFETRRQGLGGRWRIGETASWS